MHKLERGKPPEALARHARNGNQWQDISWDEKQQIRTELVHMQGERCAYCERSLQGKPWHIDHFRQRSLYPAGCFEWANLFGSCDDEHCCAKNKDKLANRYDWQKIIKPDADNPDDFLQFFADGTIAPRTDLDAEALQRASETLRVMNLDAKHGKLRHMRKHAISGWLDSLTKIRQQLLEGTAMEPSAPDTLEILEALVSDELEKMCDQTAMLPFSTAIRHSLQVFATPSGFPRESRLPSLGLPTAQ